MKIGFTADAHLRSKGESGERYNAVGDVLKQCREDGATHLVIAGDLFDSSLQNYTDFEDLCKQAALMDIHIIPGNHDLDLRQEHFSSPNIKVYTEPTWVEFDLEWSILFIPYAAGKSMGEMIEKQIDRKPSDKWVLVGHGDWSTGVRTPNPYEPGVYMPLTRRDISSYKPDLVILGHIHVPFSTEKVYYSGSPCGLDITETGFRRFLILDSETGGIESKRIHTDMIYFIENLLILPLDDEAGYIRDEINKSIERWGLNSEDQERVLLRVTCRGYCSDKGQLLETIRDGYRAFRLESEPDLSDVSTAQDPERDYLMEKVSEKVADLDWPSTTGEPSRDEILLGAMRTIYGEK